jgi:hypothetical protein
MSQQSTLRMGSESAKVIPVEYYPDRKLCPNNLDVARESMHEYMISKHGKKGGFILNKSYYIKPDPPKPTSITTPNDTLEFKIAYDAYFEELKQVRKFNSVAVEERTSMFGDIYSALKQSARDKLSSATGFSTVFAAADDPLALWTLLESALITGNVGDKVSIKGAAREAYNRYGQINTQAIEDFNKGFVSRYKAMIAAGWDKIGDEELAYDYIYKLNRAKYSSLLESIENGILPLPATVEKAYETALRWKTSRPVGASYYVDKAPAHSYVTSSQMQKPPQRGASRDGSKPAARTGYQRLPASLFRELRQKGIAAGYAPGSCFGCGSTEHKYHECPHVKSTPGHEAQSAMMSEEYDYCEDEYAYAVDRWGSPEEHSLDISGVYREHDEVASSMENTDEADEEREQKLGYQAYLDFISEAKRSSEVSPSSEGDLARQLAMVADRNTAYNGVLSVEDEDVEDVGSLSEWDHEHPPSAVGSEADIHQPSDEGDAYAAYDHDEDNMPALLYDSDSDSDGPPSLVGSDSSVEDTLARATEIFARPHGPVQVRRGADAPAQPIVIERVIATRQYYVSPARGVINRAPATPEEPALLPACIEEESPALLPACIEEENLDEASISPTLAPTALPAIVLLPACIEEKDSDELPHGDDFSTNGLRSIPWETGDLISEQRDTQFAYASATERTPQHYRYYRYGIDSMCSHHIFGQNDDITSIRTCRPMKFKGIGGVETVTKIGLHPIWGEVYVRDGARSPNLLSLSMLEDSGTYSIIYHQHFGYFTVTTSAGTTFVFSRKGGRLYTSDGTSNDLQPMDRFKARLVGRGDLPGARSELYRGEGDHLATRIVEDISRGAIPRPVHRIRGINPRDNTSRSARPPSRAPALDPCSSVSIYRSRAPPSKTQRAPKSSPASVSYCHAYAPPIASGDKPQHQDKEDTRVSSGWVSYFPLTLVLFFAALSLSNGLSIVPSAHLSSRRLHSDSLALSLVTALTSSALDAVHGMRVPSSLVEGMSMGDADAAGALETLAMQHSYWNSWGSSQIFEAGEIERVEPAHVVQERYEAFSRATVPVNQAVPVTEVSCVIPRFVLPQKPLDPQSLGSYHVMTIYHSNPEEIGGVSTAAQDTSGLAINPERNGGASTVARGPFEAAINLGKIGGARMILGTSARTARLESLLYHEGATLEIGGESHRSRAPTDTIHLGAVWLEPVLEDTCWTNESAHEELAPSAAGTEYKLGGEWPSPFREGHAREMEDLVVKSGALETSLLLGARYGLGAFVARAATPGSVDEQRCVCAHARAEETDGLCFGCKLGLEKSMHEQEPAASAWYGEWGASYGLAIAPKDTGAPLAGLGTGVACREHGDFFRDMSTAVGGYDGDGCEQPTSACTSAVWSWIDRGRYELGEDACVTATLGAGSLGCPGAWASTGPLNA